MKLSPQIINSIAQDLNCGLICVINLDTCEYETLLSESLTIYGEEYEDDPLFKEARKKIESWENTTTIEPPYSGLSFRFMEEFVDEVIPEGSALQERLYTVLSKSKPFRNFKNTIDYSDYREAWFAFRDKCFIEYVEKELSLYINNESEDEK